jgi:hypothetical protein
MHKAGIERRRKIAVLKQSPFCMTHTDVSRVSFYKKQVGNREMIKLSEALVGGALAHLKVSWRLTALFPCLETWHVRSPGLTVSFGVPYVPCAGV